MDPTRLPSSKKPVEFIGASRREPRSMPRQVRYVFGYAILLAEMGDKHPDAKPLKGFGSAGVLEVVEDFDRNTYRAVYTVQFEGVVYVPCAFQKKSLKGKKTPPKDINLVKSRLKLAEEHYRIHYQSKKAG
jgi:phage-related protein